MTEDIQGQVPPTPAPADTQAPQEKMVPQESVNKLFGSVRDEAYKKGFDDALKRAQTEPSSAQTVASGAMTREQVEEMILERSQQLQMQNQRQAEAQLVVNQFVEKMNGGKQAYEDFEDVVKDIDFSTIPEIVRLATDMPNTHDLMYDMAKNPYKIANLKSLAQTSPALARREIERLSKSIEDNKSAKNQNLPREPLSQMKPSANVQTSDRPMTLADMKKQKWAKG